MTDEEFVRQHWFLVLDDGYSVEVVNGIKFAGNRNRWSAAAEFTRNRREQIRQVEREIEAVRAAQEYWIRYTDDPKICLWSRILAREQAALAELRRGMRQSSPEKES